MKSYSYPSSIRVVILPMASWSASIFKSIAFQRRHNLPGS